MFLAIRRFFNRNKRRFLITSGVIAAVYLGLGYLKKRFDDYQRQIAQERIQRARIRDKFERTQEDCLVTVGALCSVVNQRILTEIPVEDITRELQARRKVQTGKEGSLTGSSIDDSVAGESSATDAGDTAGEVELKTKSQLWVELKILSITRLLTLIYTDALVVLLTRLQLNILARSEYLEDAIDQASKKHGFQLKDADLLNDVDDVKDYTSEEEYLALSWWVLNRGWVALKQLIQQAVEDVFEEISPRYDLDIEEFAVLIGRVSQVLKQGLDLDKLLLPPPELQQFVIRSVNDSAPVDETVPLENKADSGSNNLDLLVQETHGYLKAPSCQIVYDSLVSTSLNQVLAQLVSKHQGSTVKLAMVLATVTKSSQMMKDPLDIVQSMDQVVELDELSASVYSNFE